MEVIRSCAEQARQRLATFDLRSMMEIGRASWRTMALWIFWYLTPIGWILSGLMWLRTILFEPRHRRINEGIDAVIVTGASSGIGKYTALYLLEMAGFVVYAGVTKKEEIKELRRLAKHKNRMVPLTVDLSDANSVKRFVELVERDAAEHSRNIVGLFNNAGIATAFSPIERTPIENFEKNFDVNYFGTVRLTTAMLPLLRRSRERASGCTIINNVSMEGRLALPFQQPYASTKAALESFTDSLRREICKFGINVVALEPGFVKSGLFDKLRAEVAERGGERALQDELYPEFSKVYIHYLNNGLRVASSPRRVAEVVHEAFTATKPRVRYQTGGLAGLMMLVSMLPDKMTDWMIERYIAMLPANQKLEEPNVRREDVELDFMGEMEAEGAEEQEEIHKQQ